MCCLPSHIAAPNRPPPPRNLLLPQCSLSWLLEHLCLPSHQGSDLRPILTAPAQLTRPAIPSAPPPAPPAASLNLSLLFPSNHPSQLPYWVGSSWSTLWAIKERALTGPRSTILQTQALTMLTILPTRCRAITLFFIQTTTLMRQKQRLLDKTPRQSGWASLTVLENSWGQTLWTTMATFHRENRRRKTFKYPIAVPTIT